MTLAVMPQAGLVKSAARLSLAPATWGVITALSVLTVSVRAALRDLQGHSSVLYVLLSVVVVPIAVGAVAAMTSTRTMSTRAWVTVAATTWISAGAVRILVESLLAAAWGLPGQLLGWNVYAAQLITAPLWAGLLGVVRAMNVRVEELITRQEQLVTRLQMTTSERWDELAAERAILAEDVARMIKPEIKRIGALLETSEPSDLRGELRDELHHVAERSRDLVRRSSFETAELADRRRRLDEEFSDDIRHTRAGFVPAIRSTNAWGASPRAVVVALAFTMLPVTLVSGAAAWWLTASVMAVTLLVNVTAWKLTGRLLPFLPVAAAWTVVVAVNLASPLLSFLIVTNALSRFTGATFEARLPIVAGSLLLLSGLVITGAQVWARERSELLRSIDAVETLRDELEAIDADTQVEYDRVCAQTARLLHGPIQGRLAAVVMSLQFGARDGEGITAETLASCRALVDACLADLDVLARADATPPPVESALRELRRRWSGLIDVRWTVEAEAARRIDADTGLRAQVEDLLGDCVTNASRHGSARHIHLTVEADASSGVDVTAEDDGSGLILPMTLGSGLGSLGQLAVDWSIGSGDNGGCLVRARLPVGSHVPTESARVRPSVADANA